MIHSESCWSSDIHYYANIMLNNAKQVKQFTFKNIASAHFYMLFYLNDLLHFNVVKNLKVLYEARGKPEKAE